MRAIITALCISCLGSVLAAQQWECRMSTECLDTESCGESAYEFSLGALEDRFLLSDISGERAMQEVAVLDEPDQRAFVSMVQNTMVGLVSLYPDGQAHYSLHSADFSVRYSGTCEVAS